MKNKDLMLRIAGVLTSHASYFAGFALVYWWMSSQHVVEFERLFWGCFSILGGFCFARFFMMKRLKLANDELVDRIALLEEKLDRKG